MERCIKGRGDERCGSAMGHANGMKIAITGAAGFIGRAVVSRITGGALGPVADLCLNDVQGFTHPNATVIRGTYADEAVRRQLTADGVDILFHLASLPGGAQTSQLCTSTFPQSQ